VVPNDREFLAEHYVVRLSLWKSVIRFFWFHQRSPANHDRWT